jgi:hypothetical protein
VAASLLKMDIFILISAGLAILGYATGTIELLRLRRFLRVGVKGKGKRIGFTTIRDHDNDEIEVPVLEHTDRTGRTIKNKLDDNLHSDKSEIDIIYDPKNPRKIILNDWTKNIPWVFLMTFGTLALIFMAIELASR